MSGNTVNSISETLMDVISCGQNCRFCSDKKIALAGLFWDTSAKESMMACVLDKIRSDVTLPM